MKMHLLPAQQSLIAVQTGHASPHVAGKWFVNRFFVICTE
jgi:hypothetical protein